MAIGPVGSHDVVARVAADLQQGEAIGHVCVCVWGGTVWWLEA